MLTAAIAGVVDHPCIKHRSLEMTLVYAKITDRVVADAYASVCEQIDALYATANTPGALPAEIETAAMARLRQESHARMLGNGMCTRLVELDCRMETICETAPKRHPLDSDPAYNAGSETLPGSVVSVGSNSQRGSTPRDSHPPLARGWLGEGCARRRRLHPYRHFRYAGWSDSPARYVAHPAGSTDRLTCRSVEPVSNLAPDGPPVGVAMAATHYAKSGELNIAYRAVGDGPGDLVYVPGWVTNVEVVQEDPGMARFLRRLASFSRLIYFDKRGIGLSDPVPLGELPDLETRVEDLRAVLDAAGAERADLFGHSEGGSTAVAFTAAYPERVERLILFGSYAKRLWSEDYPWAPTLEDREAESEGFEQAWDDPSRIAEYYAPSRADDAAFIEWVGRWLRLSASPKAAASLNRASSHIDVTDLLPRIRVPTLLLYRRDDPDVRIEEGRYIASKIPGAKLVELEGADHFFWAGDTEPILQEIEEFVTGHRAAAAPERRLATALFTDIVGSTDTAAALGDQRWRDLLDRHNDVVRAELAKWRGEEVKATGDGFLATFDSPAQAIRCARAIVEHVAALGIQVRSGIHTGEMEIADHDVGGLAVHIGARIAALAGAREVLVSRTVKDLVAGGGFAFESRGRHILKGVPDEWEVFGVG